MVADYEREGFVVFRHDPRVLTWANAAHKAALQVVENPGDLRHGQTWRVGLDELPNAQDGSVAGVPLVGAWSDHVAAPKVWHRAQLSVVYPGYPRRDPGDSDGAHRFRVNRCAAHLDGLLPEGPDKRRHLREPHAFILGLPLNHATGSPLVVWAGSQKVIVAAFAEVFAGRDPISWGNLDVTEVYQAARAKVFETCARVSVPIQPGQGVLVHRHLIHGVAPWGNGEAPAEGRMIAYFRPLADPISSWLT